MPIINDPNQLQPPQPSGPMQNSPAGKKTQGTGFTNLSRVLGANTRSNIGQKFGEKLGQNVGQQQSQFGKAQTSFQQGVAQNRLDTEQNRQLRQQQLQGIMAPGEVSTAENTAAGPTVSPEIAASFAKFRGGQYTGPKELEGAAQLQAQGQQLSNLGQQFGTQAGRFNLLKQTIARGPYAQGQQRLDDILLQSQRQAVKPTIQQGVQAGRQIEQGTKAAELTGQEVTGRSQQFGEETKAQLQQGAQQNIKYLQDVAKKAEEEKAARLKSIQDQISSGSGDVEIDEATAKELGIAGGEDAWSDIGQAIQASAAKANIGNVASAADYARMKALQQLGGADTQSYLGSQGFNVEATPQAREFFKNQLAYDKNMAQTLAANRRSNYEQSAQGILQQMVDTIRDIKMYDNTGGFVAAPSMQGYYQGEQERRKNVILPGQIDWLRRRAAEQGFNIDAGRIASELQQRDLTDTPYYQGVRQNVLSEFSPYLKAARTFKIKPKTPTS